MSKNFPSIANAGLFSTVKPRLSNAILSAINELGFVEMTPVQSSAIPLFLQKKDVVVEAVTGSGKTLSFVIPVVEMLLQRETPLLKNQVGSIIISPTRELAVQTYAVLEGILSIINQELSDTKRIKLQLFIGGNNVQEDIQSYQEEGGHIIVGTPGRLDDLIKRSYVFNVKEFEVLILDEADRLLDMGFQTSLSSIITKLPKQRRTGLFSATMTDALSELVRAGLRNPIKVSVKVQDLQNNEIKTPSSLQINYLLCNPDEKLLHLVHFLTLHNNQKSILYFCTCACVDYFYKVLSSLPQFAVFEMFSMHGKMESKKREKVYTGFTEAAAPSILICTDVAARGLDIPDVDWVIQYDPPQDPQAFNHRCGRTARMGREGNAIVFLTETEDAYIEFLEIRKVPVIEYTLPASESFTLTKEELCTILQDKSISDREMYEKSLKAFVSWVRSYNEHHAKFIFKFADIDLGAVASCFGLLHLPKMPEIKNKNIEFQGRDVKLSSIAFKDKIREKQRLGKLEKLAQMKLLNLNTKKHKKETIAWSDQKNTKQKKLNRKEKKVRKKEAILKAKESGTFVAKSSNVGKRVMVDMSEWEELQADVRKAKKSKKAGMVNTLSSDEELSVGDEDIA